MPDREKLSEFIAWCAKHITGDEKGQAQIFLDRLFQAFGQAGCLDVGGATEFRIRKADEDGGGTAHTHTPGQINQILKARAAFGNEGRFLIKNSRHIFEIRAFSEQSEI